MKEPTDHNVHEGLSAAVLWGKQAQRINVRNMYMKAEAEMSQMEGVSQLLMLERKLEIAKFPQM